MSAKPVRWVMTGTGKPLVPAEFELPVPAADEVVVEIAGCGVCHTDLGYYYDGVRTKHALPLALGHEISGRVIEAVNGKLVETSIDGGRRVIRNLSQPLPIAIGTKRSRTRAR